eukprot:CAMPEP_0204575342 /NCGR_PEP_ID=MMETSP0661-20131031/41140_1 /ASSEMBLY_ACC=CAM_ASM_000606 /TAXON_ID=109239 /ORGANISM="Alexandrium margalefi, Strain AMGDE01CS-322" /LENGTH=50 /DNA_ID=CAMNT_0051583967 /DNA_START=26 /DNA_END=175 /DNA_ORIENTATION=-
MTISMCRTVDERAIILTARLGGHSEFSRQGCRWPECKVALAGPGLAGRYQ